MRDDGQTVGYYAWVIKVYVIFVFGYEHNQQILRK